MVIMTTAVAFMVSISFVTPTSTSPVTGMALVLGRVLTPRPVSVFPSFLFVVIVVRPMLVFVTLSFPLAFLFASLPIRLAVHYCCCCCCCCRRGAQHFFVQFPLVNCLRLFLPRRHAHEKHWIFVSHAKGFVLFRHGRFCRLTGSSSSSSHYRCFPSRSRHGRIHSFIVSSHIQIRLLRTSSTTTRRRRHYLLAQQVLFLLRRGIGLGDFGIGALARVHPINAPIEARGSFSGNLVKLVLLSFLLNLASEVLRLLLFRSLLLFCDPHLFLIGNVFGVPSGNIL
jgi:hypothetical protein